MSEFLFYRNCVNWPEEDVHSDGGLVDLIDEATDIVRSTFLKRVNREDLMNLEEDLGYQKHHKRGLTMAADWHVSYYRSKHHGETVYYFRHSAIEYVFKEKES